MSLVLELCELISKDIMSGQYAGLKKLPTERALAEQYGVGRPSIHAALVRLQHQGLIKIIPRHGWEIMDLRKYGKMDVLEMAINLKLGQVNQDLVSDLVEFFKVITNAIIYKIVESGFNQFEIDDFLVGFETLKHESDEPCNFGESVFHFYHRLAMRCENGVYPMIINNLKEGIIQMASNCSESIVMDFESQCRACLSAMSEGDYALAAKRHEQAITNLYGSWHQGKDTV